MLAEVFSEYSVEAGKITRVFKPNTAAYHVLRPVSRLAENRKEIANRGLSLSGDVAGDQFPIDRWNLT
jgi:hypothetical protein